MKITFFVVIACALFLQCSVFGQTTRDDYTAPVRKLYQQHLKELDDRRAEERADNDAQERAYEQKQDEATDKVLRNLWRFLSVMVVILAVYLTLALRAARRRSSLLLEKFEKFTERDSRQKERLIQVLEAIANRSAATGSAPPEADRASRPPRSDT